MQSYANQLVSFRALNKEDFPARLPRVKTSKTDLLGSVTSSARLKALPASAFLVPAVIEAIMSSNYSRVTSVIPGEADAYCAQSARTHGGTIFTSDSDLLVHDLGSNGKVVLFKDIESIHLPSKGKCLKTQQYQPSAIAEKFDLPNLVRLAFFMTEDNHSTFIEATVLAKERNQTSEEFTTFREQYGSLPVLSTLAAEYLTHSERPVFKLLSRLDPRLSELVHQISMNDGDTPRANGDGTLDMYLPFLIDDPTRTSAWRAGAEIRRLSYSLLRLLDPSIESINEYERKGTRVAETLTPLYPLDSLHVEISQLTYTLPISLEQAVLTSEAIKWRKTAIKHLCTFALETGKSPPSTTDLTRLITGTSGTNTISWSHIQTTAQMHSILYSLRLLLQTSQIVLGFLDDAHRNTSPQTMTGRTLDLMVGRGQHYGRDSGIAVALRRLRDQLTSLPSLAHLLDDETEVPSDVEMATVKSSVHEVLRELGVGTDEKEEETVLASSSSSKRKKKRKKRDEEAGASAQAQTQTAPPAWRANNPFGSLA